VTERFFQKQAELPAGDGTGADGQKTAFFGMVNRGEENGLRESINRHG
jgi:hypothetical protein